MESRIPALNGLVTFVPSGQESDPVLEQTVNRNGSSRWFPQPGGHRLVVFYKGGNYDAQQFTVESGAWDHEHCKLCRDSIPSMTLCWVTERGPYIILCDACHTKLINFNATGLA